MRKLLTVDPSMNTAGWAYWDNYREDDWKERCGPVDSGAIWSKGKTWENRACDMAVRLSTRLKTLRFTDGEDFVAIEFPKFFEGGKGGVAARGGSLIKLTLAVGMLWGVCENMCLNVIRIEAGVWNGQLGKRMMEARVATATGETYKEHAYDAVGMGLWLKGWFPNPRNGWQGFPDLDGLVS